jgi:predicted ATPase
MKIAVVGTQCIGKSTYINDFLKKWPMYSTPEKTYRDIIKEKNLKYNENGNEESQKIILDCLIDQTIQYSKKDFVIFDRCILDNLAYTAWLNMDGKVSDEFFEQSRLIVKECLKLYDILFFLPLTKFSKINLTENELRSVDPAYREEVDSLFKVFQISYNKADGRVFPAEDCPALIEIFGSPEERIALTTMYIQPDGTPFGEEQSFMSDIIQAKPKIHLPENFNLTDS